MKKWPHWSNGDRFVRLDRETHREVMELCKRRGSAMRTTLPILVKAGLRHAPSLKFPAPRDSRRKGMVKEQY